jgi:hypothetical protein
VTIWPLNDDGVNQPLEDDFLIRAGHPYTCNGGNPDWRTHHDHQVIMVREGNELRCPECGRTQHLAG